MINYEQQKEILSLIQEGMQFQLQEMRFGRPLSQNPAYSIWIGKVKLFSKRHLLEHPLNKDLQTACFFWNDKEKGLNALIGVLQAVADDKEYWSEEHTSAVIDMQVFGSQNDQAQSTEEPMSAKNTGKIFISHRSTDKDIADMLLDFFVATGISRDVVFCSSLPGNDINEKISAEVKRAIELSTLNIAILSKDYYESAYCLNEAGIIWLHDNIPAIPVALPEITSNNMYGFFNNEYKIRRLDNNDDISYIYDVACERAGANQVKAAVISAESTKLIKKYSAYISGRVLEQIPKTSDNSLEIISDDEAVVLYHVLKKKARKVHKQDVKTWMTEQEIYDVNIDNGFDLLASFGKGKSSDDVLELDMDWFRSVAAESENYLAELKPYVNSHCILSGDEFVRKWESGELNDECKLFTAYLVEEQISSLGDRWQAEMQIESIKEWEAKNQLNSVLSDNYGSCLGCFVNNRFVFESAWTSYGNPKEYTLCTSLRKLLLSNRFPFLDEVSVVKANNAFELPF